MKKYYNELLDKTEQALTQLKETVQLIRNETEKVTIALGLQSICNAYEIMGVNTHDKLFKKIGKKIKSATPVALLHFRDELIEVIEKDIPEIEGIITRSKAKIELIHKKSKVNKATSIMNNTAEV